MLVGYLAHPLPIHRAHIVVNAWGTLTPIHQGRLFGAAEGPVILPALEFGRGLVARLHPGFELADFLASNNPGL